MENKDYKMIMLILICMAVVTICGSFAYFYAVVTGTGNTTNNTTSTTAISLGTINYDGTLTFTGSDIYPGYYGIQTFTISPGSQNGIGTYQIDLNSTLPTEFGTDVEITLYKTTDPTNNYLTKTTGTLTKNSNHFYQEDTLTTTGTLTTVYSGTLTNNSQIILSEEDFTIPGFNTTTYYLVYHYKKNGNQNTQEGKVFSGKVTVNLLTPGERTPYKDSTGASYPELYQGLIPVTYDASGNTVVADTYSEWYNYSSHNWANAVLVNCADSTTKSKYFNDDMSIKSSVVGTTMTESEILQYYVWIPRYKYLLWNAENGSSDPQAISITFERTTDTKSTGSTNGTWLTHPAFTFGTTELNGIWVGKFENSGSTTNLTIKPNITSLRGISLGAMFNATRNIELTYASNFGISSSQIDTHVIKNMDWGAVAYLSSSIYGRYTDSTTCISSGCEVWNNPSNVFLTGCAGTSVIASMGSTCNAWNSILGANASTSGTQYGIYDMSGGAWDYVMGAMQSSTGTFYSGSSSMPTVDSKYYDSYPYGTNEYDFSRSKLGDATKEIIKTANTSYGSWYSNYSSMLAPGVEEGYWYMRGGACVYNGTLEGIYTFYTFFDNAYIYGSFRSVLTAE